LIGAGQAGVIVGRKALIDRLRKHPLMRAVRIDKICLLALERTLHLFRNPELLRRENPTYRMICTPLETLHQRARTLVEAIAKAVPRVKTIIEDSAAYLGSGSLPTQALRSVTVSVTGPGLSAAELARRLRLDPACVFGRIEAERVRLDLRTITDSQVQMIADAIKRVAA
jgi:L-seryl-tRNA(Ser) seleniumtransferase